MMSDDVLDMASAFVNHMTDEDVVAFVILAQPPDVDERIVTIPVMASNVNGGVEAKAAFLEVMVEFLRESSSIIELKGSLPN